MTKKISATKSLAKKLYRDYKERLWELVVKFIEDEIKNLGDWVKNVTHLKEKIRKVVSSLILIIGGVFLVLLGLGELVANLFGWNDSVGYIFVGCIAIIAAVIYNKT